MSMSEEAELVEQALRCAETGDAGHWPTAAGFLAEEIYRLRAELAEWRTAAVVMARVASARTVAGDALAECVLDTRVSDRQEAHRLSRAVDVWQATRADAPCQGSCVGCGSGVNQVCSGSCPCVVSGVHDRDGYATGGGS